MHSPAQRSGGRLRNLGCYTYNCRIEFFQSAFIAFRNVESLSLKIDRSGVREGYIFYFCNSYRLTLQKRSALQLILFVPI